ncbi:MAG TPA: adventurous gliding motility TPR repeat lipoprotein GltE [Anaeromyxobacteraceae bacterium]|nr:adventurous gliding motility TPR repeat lipoprotein GltE [Anaeromyxobacteraceae bacterium]
MTALVKGWLLVPLVALLGCATGGGASQVAPAAPAPAAPPPAAAPAANAAQSAPAGGKRELSPRAQRLFDEAVAAYEEQKRLKVPIDWETLEHRWRAVTEAEPVPEAYFNLGVVLEHRRQKDEARAAYRKALELNPGFGAAAVNLALLDEPEDPHQSALSFAELARRYPDDPLPRERLSALYEATGQHDEAWRLGREALMRDPRSVGAYKVLMHAALDGGHPDLALLLAVKARKLDESDPELVGFVGDVRYRQKDEVGAVAQWRKAVALKDDYLPARYALLAVAVGHQHWEGVAEQARAILKVRPDDAHVELALGVAYRHLGQVDQALTAYDDAERLSGDRIPEVHLARGVALMKGKEQCEPAIGELKKYLVQAGPAAATEGPAMRLIQECTQIEAAGRAAEEAAREMKAEQEEAARKKAAASGEAAPPAAAPESEGRVAPTR